VRQRAVAAHASDRDGDVVRRSHGGTVAQHQPA
jgi:hypothetical protein